MLADPPPPLPRRAGLLCIQDVLYAGINTAMRTTPMLDEEFTTNKKMSSLSLNGTPFHVKFIKNYCAPHARPTLHPTPHPHATLAHDPAAPRLTRATLALFRYRLASTLHIIDCIAPLAVGRALHAAAAAVTFVLTSNAVVTYAMLASDAAAAVLAAPACLWQLTFHLGVIYIENGSETWKSLHLPLHTTLGSVWACLGLGYLALKYKR